MNRSSGQCDSALLMEYALGRLEPGRRNAVVRHAEQCDDCARRLAEYSTVSDALDLWEPPPVSTAFNRELWQRIDASNNAPWYRQLADLFGPGAWKRAIPVAAAALVIATGFLLDHPYRTAAPSANHFSATEADQAEHTLDDLQLLHQFDADVAAPTSGKSM